MHIDPITFEVVKHRLWQINDEQGVTIRTISTSPIVVEGNDMNAGIFTAEGDLVVAGQYVLVHVTTMDTVIKNVIDHASDVEEGDVFLVNDPYWGALHQNDVAVVGPVFYQGRLILWVGNVLHHADLAGMDEGSFCINATSVFQEAPRYFLKVVQRGKVSKEVERTFTMNSRLPDMVALDLRAQLGAINVAKQRLTEFLDQWGVDVVLAVLRQSVDFAEQQMRERISELPDGTWSTEVFMDTDRVGSERIIRAKLRLDKRGDELFFDYTGTDPQTEGPVNCTYAPCYAGTTTSVYTFLCSGDVDWNGSIKRCVHVYAPEGSVMNANYPAAVSICSIGFTQIATVAGQRVVAQMLASSEKHRGQATAVWGASINANNIFGHTAAGKYVGSLLSDHRGTGGGARSFADGFDHGGQITSSFSYQANVESQEWKLPILYVFRRQLVDSGGPGKYRGGLTAAAAVVPYNAQDLIWKSQNTTGSDESNAAGLEGGFPGAGSQVSVIHDTEIWEKFREGDIPLTLEDIGGHPVHLATKSGGSLGPDDVFFYYAPGGGGFGDPLERDPARVRIDVLDHAVSREWAHRGYGVLLTDTLEVDESATLRERRRRLNERLGHEPARMTEDARLTSLPLGGGERIAEFLERVPLEHGSAVRCSRCGHILSRDGEDDLAGAVCRETALAQAGPWLALRWQGQSERFHLVETLCPSCGVMLRVEEKQNSVA